MAEGLFRVREAITWENSVCALPGKISDTETEGRKRLPHDGIRIRAHARVCARSASYDHQGQKVLLSRVADSGGGCILPMGKRIVPLWGWQTNGVCQPGIKLTRRRIRPRVCRHEMAQIMIRHSRADNQDILLP